MILQALTRYYEALERQGKIARPGWAKQRIGYALCIDARGELERVTPLLEDRGGKKPQPRGPRGTRSVFRGRGDAGRKAQLCEQGEQSEALARASPRLTSPARFATMKQWSGREKEHEI